EAKFALALYDKDGKLKDVVTEDKVIPARSVPQIGMVGAPKLVDDGSPSPWAKEDNRSPMGDPEIIVEINCPATIEEGDRVKLFAWDMGIEKAMESIISIPYEATTDSNRYLMRESFTYDGTKKLTLDQDETTFNGWIAKGYNSSGSVAFDDNSYVAVTKAPFGNTGLHVYRKGGEGLMVSHALPDTNGADYTIEFTIRYINELSWNNTDNAGFTLSHGVPTAKNDSTNSVSAFQFRHMVQWQDENGRGTNGMVRNTIAFDGGSETNIFHGGLSRTINTSEMVREDYDKGEGYYDPETETYIHDYNDSLMVGSLYTFKVDVHPELKQIDMSVNDGYRTATYTTFYNNSSSYDWAANPIDTITFSIGSEKWGEMYIDDFSVRLSTQGTGAKVVDMSRADGGTLNLGSGQFTMLPLSDGAYVFIDRADGKSIDVSGQSSAIGASVGTYTYNGGNNQKFYVEETEGGYLIKGKQSGKYLGVSDSGAVTLQELENATVFTLTEIGEEQVELEEFLKELANI
ncbi:MAG: RICIN domain-containing protein, partial [Clostridia bacterium]